METKKKCEGNLPKLNNMKGNSPLAKLVQFGHNQKEFRRLKLLSSLFEQFHLKYALIDSVSGRTITLNGKIVVNFGSANYLGLEQHPDVIKASIFATTQLGTHTGTSRVFASHANMVLLENEISKMMGAQATLVGHNISQIHAGVLPALFGFDDSHIFIDRYAHTSMYQAALIARAKGAQIFSVDVSKEELLLNELSQSKAQRKVLLIDGVYSMQGHIPNLKRLNEISQHSNTLLYIDDAHGVGVFGTTGGGVVEAEALSYDNVLVTGSLQKALGTYGGFISGNQEAIDLIRVTSKAYIFSGTLQPSAVEGARMAVQIAQSEEGVKLRQRIAVTSQLIRIRLAELGFKVPHGTSPIIPVLIGKDILTLLAGRKIFDEGVYLNSVLYPAVPHGEGILRISLSATHTDSEIELLCHSFSKLKIYLDSLKSPMRATLHLLREIIKSKWQKDNYKGI